MKTHNKLQVLVTLLILSVCLIASSHAQNNHFDSGLPDDFVSLSFQVDPMGSIDKEGLNAMVSLSLITYEWIEVEIQSQFIINEEEQTSGLTYIDLQLGGGIMIPLGTRVAITPGIHFGGIYRPANVIWGPDNPGWVGGITYGLTGKARVWLGMDKRIAIVISTSYDRRPDIEGTPFRINGRGGLEIQL